jgi:hypothetical protein
MSANTNVLSRSELIAPVVAERALSPLARAREADVWNPEDFAREQIRSMVQRVFFASGVPPVRQVVFTAMGPNADVAGLCDQVGKALSLETSADVAVVGREPLQAETGHPRPQHEGSTIKCWSRQTAANLWRVPQFGLREYGEESGTGQYWASCLTRLRNEFEYAVIQGPAADVSGEFALLGQLADGIILVIEAHISRKAIARKLKKTLETTRSRILGTVLTGRRFPVPYGIYRRL